MQLLSQLTVRGKAKTLHLALAENSSFLEPHKI